MWWILFVLILMSVTYKIYQEDYSGATVCASAELYAGNAADVCQTSCNLNPMMEPDGTLVGMLWNGQWVGTSTVGCRENDAGSLCGCYVPCQCINGQQVACVDYFNPKGIGLCNTNCDCPLGKSCRNSACEDVVCCDNCEEDVLSCEYNCTEDFENDPPMLAGCLVECELQWVVAKRNCGGCPDQNVSNLLKKGRGGKKGGYKSKMKTK